ncbi:helix-turn-helix domain-containing protein [Parabacteroides distasonis]
MFVKEMAHSLGFENTTFFTQFFKRFTGSTPQEYRKH